MPISSTSLFHYTSGGLGVLKLILQTGFRVKANKEISVQSIGLFGDPGQLGFTFTQHHSGSVYPGVHYQYIPMVCFCDIRFSAIGEHLETYGHKPDDAGPGQAYAIGLTKQWGQRNGLNPILYLLPKSKLAGQLASAYQSSSETKRFEPSPGIQVEKYFPPREMGDKYFREDNQGNKFPFTYLYSKVIEKVQITQPWTSHKNNYQDEKEWRYIPDNARIVALYEWNYITRNRHLYDSMTINAKKALDECPDYDKLKFNHDDITHIIVQKDDDVLSVHDTLRDRYPDLPPEEMALLLTKVRSYEGMLKDW